MKLRKKGILWSIHKSRFLVISLLFLLISSVVSVAVKHNYLSSFSLVKEVSLPEALKSTLRATPKTPKPSGIQVFPTSSWVDSTLQRMTLDQKIGQFFMAAAYSNKDERHQSHVHNLVAQHHIGGIIFFQGGPHRQAVLTNRYQAAASVPLFVGIDGEWGLGMRLDSTISFPRQMTLGAVEDNQLIYQMGVEIANQCKRLGIHINFAPVADINSNPTNPVIGNRSFGEDKHNVAAKASAYMKGMQHQHILTAAKHFPGHGDTSTDSHYDLPVLTHSYETLLETDLYPFKKLINDSIVGIMSGHLHIPAIDNTIDVPATLSPKVINGLLREKLGFNGLVFTDAMNMKGVLKTGRSAEINLKALLAGNDILVFAQAIPESIALIKTAVKNKTISEKFINEKVRRILQAKYWAGLHQQKPVELQNLVSDLNPNSSHQLIRKLQAAAVTVARNEHQLLPLHNESLEGVTSVSIGAKSQTLFQKTLTQLHSPISHHLFAASDLNQSDVTNMLNYLKPYSTVIVSVHGVTTRSSNNYGIHPLTSDFIHQLKASGKKVILTVFGNPYSLRVLPVTDVTICTIDDNTTTQQTAARAIMGATSVNGQLPVSAPSVSANTGVTINALNQLVADTPENVGVKSETLNEISIVVQDAINQKVFPGCQILIAKKGKIIYDNTFGYLTYQASNAVNSNTVYDLASVTKVAATVQALMLLYDQGSLQLTDKASKYLPELLATDKKNITIKELLIHKSGLVAYYPTLWRNTMTPTRELKPEYYQFTPSSEYTIQVAPKLYAHKSMPDSVWKWVIESPLRTKSARASEYSFVYSDLGFLMLQKVIERITNQSLDTFLHQHLYQPLHIPSLTYRPLESVASNLIAPTENDSKYRGQLIQGTVHDPMAAMVGGVAGHAGLFGNAHSLAVLLQMNLWKGAYAGKQYFKSSTIEEFTKLASLSGNRALGWVKSKQDPQSNVVSPNASPDSYGHTGFTGNVVWVDPKEELIFIFLSNRVHPNAENNRLNSHMTRRKIHDLIYQAIEPTI